MAWRVLWQPFEPLAELVGDELLEVGRHPGRFVRALARTSRAATVAAIVLPDDVGTRGAQATADLERELDDLRRVFGDPLIKLVYGMTSRADRPLEVERVPDGALV